MPSFQQCTKFIKFFKKCIPNLVCALFMDFYFYLLSQIRMDHSKFDNLEKGLKGEIIVNKLFDGFELVLLFRRIKSNLPSDTHG